MLWIAKLIAPDCTTAPHNDPACVGCGDRTLSRSGNLELSTMKVKLKTKLQIVMVDNRAAHVRKTAELLKLSPLYQISAPENVTTAPRTIATRWRVGQ